jgi:hypothetical protein
LGRTDPDSEDRIFTRRRTMKKHWLTAASVMLSGAAALATTSAQAFWGNWGGGGPWYGGPWYGGPWYGGYPYYGGWGYPYGGWGYPYYGGWGYPYGGWGYPYYGGWGYPYGGWGHPYAVAPPVAAPAAPAKSKSEK